MYLCGTVTRSENAGPEVMIDGKDCASIQGATGTGIYYMTYVQKGSTITTRANYGTYNLTVYGLKTNT